jgi:hypothetical protein
VGQVVGPTEQPTPLARQVAPPVAVVTPPPIGAVPASSRDAPLKLGALGSLNGLTLRVTKVALDATKVATQRLYPETGNRYVAVKMTVGYDGSGAWGFSGLWSLKAVGKSGVVYPSSDMGCLLSLPKSDLTSGVTVMGVPSLSGWAAWLAGQEVRCGKPRDVLRPAVRIVQQRTAPADLVRLALNTVSPPLGTNQ